jgi:DNA (cytosine-5)-methyltransferase 1
MGRQATSATIQQPTAFDCFAGCGGMTEGFKQAGFRVLGAIEKDAKAGEVYALNHPEVHLWPKDIQSVTASNVLDAIRLKEGELDLLGGCPPCQGFSTLRTYNGGHRVRDKQNDLIFEFQRLILALLPKSVMMENVPGLYENRRFAEFQSALEGVGYKVKARVLNVNDYGVPQRRRRLVMLASRNADVDFAITEELRPTVHDAIGKLPQAGQSGDAVHDLPENRSSTVRRIIASIPKNGGSRSALPRDLVLECHKRSNGFKDIYGRMAWDKPAPTITTGCFNPSKGRFLHPDADRAITMREAALLQSFPMNYQFPAEMGKVRLATMIGNALPPSFIRHHAKQMLSACVGRGKDPGRD